MSYTPPAGAPRGVANCNPTNLVNAGIPWQGLAAVQPDPRFCTFVDPRWGIRAVAKTLLSYWHREIDTVRAIISAWAPPVEKQTDTYIANVCEWCELTPDEHLNLGNIDVLAPLVEAIIHQECGLMQPGDEPWYDPDLIDSACHVALGAEQPTGWPLAA